MKLIKFEGVKWWRQIKNKLLLVLVLLASITFVFMINSEKTEERQLYLEELNVDYNVVYETMMGIQMMGPELSEADAILVNRYDQAMKQINEEYIGVNTGDWQRGLAGTIAYQHLQLGFLEDGISYPLPIDESQIQLDLRNDNYFLAAGIPPMKYQQKLSGLNTLQIFCEITFGLIFGCLLILLFFDLFTSEYEHNNIKLLYTQPFKRRQFITSKLAFAILLSSGLVFILCTLVFLTATIYAQSLGWLDYPIVISADSALVLWQYLLIFFVFMLLESWIVLLLITLISLLTKRTLLTIVLSLAIVAVPFFFIMMLLDDHNSLWTWFPHYYFDLANVIPRAALNNHLAGVLMKGVLILVLALLCLVAAVSILLKKTETSPDEKQIHPKMATKL